MLGVMVSSALALVAAVPDQERMPWAIDFPDEKRPPEKGSLVVFWKR